MKTNLQVPMKPVNMEGLGWGDVSVDKVLAVCARMTT